MKISPYYMGAFFCVSLCSVNTHTILTLPPPVIFLLVAFIVMTFLVLRGDKMIDRRAFIVLPLFVLLMFTQLLFTEAPIRRIIAPLIAFLFFPVSIYFIQKLSNKQLWRIVEYFILLSLIALILETVYRFLFPNIDYMIGVEDAEENFRWIYMYKGPSLIYVDSNGTALHALIVLFFVFFWSEYIHKKLIIVKIILILVVLLSLSRAAWLGMLIGLYYFYYFRNTTLRYKLVVFFVFIVLMVVASVFYFIPYFLNDLSLLSKFEIVEVAISYFSTKRSISQVLLSGVGLSMSESALGIYAHNLWLVWLIEAGGVALLLQLVLWIQISVITKRYALIILVPFFIATLSSNFTFAPVFYVVLSIVYCVVNAKKRSNETDSNI